jgi:hypothetical protein
MTTKTFFFILCFLPVRPAQSQYNIDNPSIIQCLAAPCNYVGECRSDSNECGEGNAYCNELSTWLPACGGGGTMQKQTTLTDSTVQLVVQADTTDPQSDLGLTAGTNNEEEPSQSPTTAWDAWINSKNQGEKHQGVVGYTTGKEGEEDWAPSDTVGWFDKQGWESGNRTKDEKESLFDKYNPFSRDDNSTTKTVCQVVWLSAALVYLTAMIEL